MNYPTYNENWHDIALITNWLNEGATLPYAQESACRVMKCFEEAGEACTAYIGYTGQNPRKGFTHTKQQLLDELADVAITALCAIQFFTDDYQETQGVFEAKLKFLRQRAGI